MTYCILTHVKIEITFLKYYYYLRLFFTLFFISFHSFSLTYTRVCDTYEHACIYILQLLHLNNSRLKVLFSH